MADKHKASDLIEIFNHLFSDSENTILEHSPDEPIYLPADSENPKNRILFAHGFFQSAMHEISHWSIAGKERRKLVDFGYWYNPDGRTAEQQAEFEVVEVKPQALEWIYSMAADKKFYISVDNLSSDINPEELNASKERFADKVYQQVLDCFEQGLSDRQQAFVDALVRNYRNGAPLSADMFHRNAI